MGWQNLSEEEKEDKEKMKREKEALLKKFAEIDELTYE